MVKIATWTRVRCIVVTCKLVGKRPINPAYPENLETLGDHLRKVRLDRRMSQPQVATLLNTSTDMVTNWELNRNEPTPKFAKSIIEFLDYFPFDLKNSSLGKQLYYARLISGQTQKQVAQEIGCDESNLRLIELDMRTPKTILLKKTRDYIDYLNRKNN